MTEYHMVLQAKCEKGWLLIAASVKRVGCLLQQMQEGLVA